LEGIWKEAAVTLSRYSLGIFLERLRKAAKTTVSIASVPAEIRTEHFLNTNLDRYHFASQLGKWRVKSHDLIGWIMEYGDAKPEQAQVLGCSNSWYA
jgi:hypothetical protein